MATATSVSNTAAIPCGSTISFMNSDAWMGTYSENRNHSASTAKRISQIVLLVTAAISISAVVNTAITCRPWAGAEATDVRRQAR